MKPGERNMNREYFETVVSVIAEQMSVIATITETVFKGDLGCRRRSRNDSQY